ncbi:ARABIDOPSIS THALIANA GLUTAMATE RECEPTOR 1.3, glutamate receptor 1.3 [Hibiscus trionum]|uniref:Glutamate receptor n=1 Tax=Hibiscus trionum TaxID=183268 RepID=A0A9W7IMV3_HIBTR|nr:ARABIDOPSIS THALIANA GLUTAMATE RECEPTOR 1.3, glutamate receptor 1.3 [Hibiscus trionum]
MDFSFTRNIWTFFLVAVLFSLVQPSPANLTTIRDTAIEMIHVGLIIDSHSWVGKNVDSCISMAISEFYGRNSHYRTKLVVHARDSEGDPLLVLSHALVLLESVKLHAIIVAENSAGLKILAELGSRVEIPIISLFAAGPVLSFSEYPCLIQIGADEVSRAEGIATIVEAFGWRSVALIYEDNDSARQILPNVITSLDETGVRLAQHIALSASLTDEEIIQQLKMLMHLGTSVYVVHTSPILASRLFSNAKRLEMMSQGYAWITTDMITNFMNSMDPSVMESMQGVVGFKPHIPASKELRNFAIRWRIRNLNEDQNLQEMELNVYGIWTYDMVQVLATAAECVMARHPDIMRQENKLNINFTTIRSSQSGSVLIEEILQSRFKGVSRGFQLTSGRLIPKEFEIVNVFKGERIMGYWNPENGITSITKEENHTKTNSTSCNKLESVIWPGGTMNIPKGWNLHGKKLRIGVPVNPGFSELISVIRDPQTNKITVDGFCAEVFREAIKSLDYEVQFEFLPYANASGQLAGTYDDLIQEVYHKNYDAVVGDVTIMARRFPYVDFTLPYTDLDIGVAVPKINNNAWIFLRPLSCDLWIATAAFFIFTGIVVWFIERPINNEFQGSPWEQIGMIFWYSFSTLVFAHKENLLSNLSKFVVIIWVLVVLIITSSYTATLASMLTVQQIRLSSREDYIGYQSLVPGTIISNIKIENPRRMQFPSPEAYADALRKGSKNGGVSAIIDEIPYLKLFLAKYPSDYTVIKSKATSGGFGFVFPKGSPLVQDMSSAIVRLREEEKLQMLENKWLNNDESIFINQDSRSNPSRLNLHSFGGLFLVTGLSSTSALLLCLYQKRRAMTICNFKFYLSCTIGSVNTLLPKFRDILGHLTKTFK